jgi:hypothetical protein
MGLRTPTAARAAEPVMVVVEVAALVRGIGEGMALQSVDAVKR